MDASRTSATIEVAADAITVRINLVLVTPRGAEDEADAIRRAIAEGISAFRGIGDTASSVLSVGAGTARG